MKRKIKKAPLNNPNTETTRNNKKSQSRTPLAPPSMNLHLIHHDTIQARCTHYPQKKKADFKDSSSCRINFPFLMCKNNVEKKISCNE